MYYVYVIESIKFKKRYVGFTGNLLNRLKEHNNGETKSNKSYRPFNLIYTEEIEDKVQALKREKYLKSCAGRKYLLKIRPRSSAE
jgi:putative endonuclease